MSSVAVTHPARAVFARDSAATLRAQIESSLGEQLSSTLLFRERVSPPTVSTGIAALDRPYWRAAAWSSERIFRINFLRTYWRNDGSTRRSYATGGSVCIGRCQ